MNNNYEPLFQPFTFKSGVEVRNRLMMPPMTTFSADENDYVSQEELSYYRSRSNEVGTIVTACAYVSKNGKGFYGQMAIDHDEAIEGVSDLSDAIHAGGAKGIVQLYHGGRLAVPDLIEGGETVSASSVAPLLDRGFYSIQQAPRELTTEEVYGIIEDFAQATRRSIEAGFDGVELHGASGYIIQQFVSPHSNLRTDEFQDRHAFTEKLIQAVKAVIKEHTTKPFILGYRFSPEEPETPGITMKETFNLLDVLMEADLDYIHMTTTNARAKARRGVESNKSRTELITEYVNGRVPVVGVGNIHTPEDAVQVMETGNADFVAVGRAIIVDPEWVKKVQLNQVDTIRHFLTEDDQITATIPTPLWKLILDVEGWFPVKKAVKQ